MVFFIYLNFKRSEKKKPNKSLQKAFLIHYSCCCFFNAIRITDSTGDLLLLLLLSLLSRCQYFSTQLAKNPHVQQFYIFHYLLLLCGLFSSLQFSVLLLLLAAVLFAKRFAYTAISFARALTHTRKHTLSHTHIHSLADRQPNTYARAHNERTHVRFDPIVYTPMRVLHTEYTRRRVLYAQFILCVLSVALTLPPRLWWGVAKVFYSKIDGGTIHQQNNQMRVFIIEWVCFTNMCFVIFY